MPVVVRNVSDGRDEQGLLMLGLAIVLTIVMYQSSLSR